MSGEFGNAYNAFLQARSAYGAAQGGNYPAYLAQQAAMLNNPAVRAGLIDNPLLARRLGLTGQVGQLPTPQPPNPADNLVGAQPAQVNVPQYAWQPNLPPLDPATGLKMAQAGDVLGLRTTNPPLFNAIGGMASPQEAGQLIAQTPPNVGNVVFSPSGPTYAQQPIPWNLLSRAAESQSVGGPGFVGYGGFNPSALRGGGGAGAYNMEPTITAGGLAPQPSGGGITPLGRGAPSENVPGSNLGPTQFRLYSGVGDAQIFAALEQAGLGTADPAKVGPDGRPIEGVNQAPAPPAPAAAAPVSTQAPAAAPTAPTAPTAPMAPADTEGFIAVDPAKMPVTPPAPAAPVPPTPASGAVEANVDIGFPSQPGTPSTVPGAQPPAPRITGRPRLGVSETVTVPEGAFGTRTRTYKQIDPEAEYDNLLAKQQLKGIPDALETRIGILTIADNAFTALRNEFAPGGNYARMADFTGPLNYTAQSFVSRATPLEAFTRGIRSLGLTEKARRGEPGFLEKGGRFHNLVEGLGFIARPFAGAAFTDREFKLYGPYLMPDGTKPLSEFTTQLWRYGISLRELAKTTLAEQKQLDPSTQQRLITIINNYKDW